MRNPMNNDHYASNEKQLDDLKKQALESANLLKDFADVVEAYFVHGDINLAPWIARARLNAARIECNDDEAKFHEITLGISELNTPTGI